MDIKLTLLVDAQVVKLIAALMLARSRMLSCCLPWIWACSVQWWVFKCRTRFIVHVQLCSDSSMVNLTVVYSTNSKPVFFFFLSISTPSFNLLTRWNTYLALRVTTHILPLTYLWITYQWNTLSMIEYLKYLSCLVRQRPTSERETWICIFSS